MFKKAVLAGQLLKVHLDNGLVINMYLYDFHDKGINPDDYWNAFTYEGVTYDFNLGIGTAPEEGSVPYFSIFPVDEEGCIKTGDMISMPLEFEELDTQTVRKYLGEKYAGQSVDNLSDEDKNLLIRLLCNTVEWSTESKERLIKSCNALEVLVLSQRKELKWFNRIFNYSVGAVTLMALWGLFQ